MAAGLLVAAVLLLVVLRRTLENNVEGAAHVRANDVAALVRETNVPAVLPGPEGKEALVQVIDQNGRILAASANFEAEGPITDLRPSSGQTRSRTYRDLPIKDEQGDRFRVLALGVAGRRGPIIVYVAISLEQVEESVATVRNLLFVGVPALIALVAVTSWFIVGRALRPVDAIRQQVADISARDLGLRVPEPHSDDEIGRLARGMNQMLDRLQFFADRQRSFIADASHELQSPLASSLADLEVALAHPDSINWRETANGLVADNRRMTRLVQDLLFLAKADSPTMSVRRGPVDLDDIVLSEVARVRVRTSLEFDVSGVSPVEARANGDQLERVVRNILDNALRYARARIKLELRRDDATATLIISDDGPGIDASDGDRIFERFARLDDSRSRETGGTGLGLAIARQIIESHAGTIVLEPVAEGARFVVRLPA